MLTNDNIIQILTDFPNIELSYETVVHKKVYGVDIMFAIPEGQKAFIWFTKYKKENTCFLLEIGDSKKINNVSICKTEFEDILSYGTIFYGTIFKNINILHFAVENILYNKGKSLEKTSFLNKLTILRNIFKEQFIQKETNRSIIFGLPLFAIGDNFNKLLDDIQKLPYKISKIYFRYLYNKNQKIFSINYFKPGIKYNELNNKKHAVFKVTPDIQNDIYHLHTYNYKLNKDEYFDIAYIPDYITSVFMNSIFRNIKENSNLDALEESDDESEFENNKIDKFVYLDKKLTMNCVYNVKFKKWTPISIASNNDKINTCESLLF